MAGKLDRQTISDPFLDRRTKLLPCQKEMVVWWHRERALSAHKLARMFNVSRRTIQFILDPEKLAKNVEVRHTYYNRKKNTEAMRDHREYKKKILKDKS